MGQVDSTQMDKANAARIRGVPGESFGHPPSEYIKLNLMISDVIDQGREFFHSMCFVGYDDAFEQEELEL